MCILFSYISKRLKPGEFQLILLSNRDEYFHRPSETAKFMPPSSSLYGVDLTPGKEGGTWLGCSSQQAKIAALLNLNSHDYPASVDNKLGRGFLVPNFLNGTFSADEYIEQIRKSATELYTPFNLLMFEKHEHKWKLNIFENFTPSQMKADEEFTSISNHIFAAPFEKTVMGDGLFRKIVTGAKSVHQKEELIKKLLQLAKNDAGKSFQEIVNPDEHSVRQLIRQQVFVNAPNYGTRTHTVILVDDENNVTFIEKSLRFPIEIENPVWLENKFEFKITQ